jgi:hypothetical protein
MRSKTATRLCKGDTHYHMVPSSIRRRRASIEGGKSLIDTVFAETGFYKVHLGCQTESGSV